MSRASDNEVTVPLLDDDEAGHLDEQPEDCITTDPTATTPTPHAHENGLRVCACALCLLSV